MSGKLFVLNNKLAQMGKDNGMWHKIYTKRFKNPGFKVDKVQWKEALIKKTQ